MPVAILITILIISALWAAAVAFLVIRAVIQYQAYTQIVPRAAGPTPPSSADRSATDDDPQVGVIIPARNEAGNIERSLSAMLQQDYPASRLKIIVVDDDSTDGTARLAQFIASKDARVELIESGVLPHGWKGKPHACAAGAERAIAANCAWLCFVDADTFAAPTTIAKAIKAARDNGFDMLSLEPFQELGSFGERLIIPCGFFVMAFTHDLRRVNDPKLPDAVANGQFILIRAEVYQQVGGHTSVRDEICEDSALARQVKSSGHRLAVWGAEALLHTRMYRDWPSLWQGLAKNVSEMVGGPGKVMMLAVIGLTLAAATVALPIITALLVIDSPHSPMSWMAAALAWMGTTTMIAIHVGGANYLRISRWYGLLFPIGYAVGAVLAVQSALMRRAGRVRWKGRIYDAAGPSSPMGRRIGKPMP